MRPEEASRRRGVVGVAAEAGKLLVIQRSERVAAPGKLCFPGGGIEAGEEEPQALRRELFEELGVRVLPIRPLWTSTTTWNVDLTWWLMALPQGRVLQPNPLEVAACFWREPAELIRAPELLPSNRDFLAALDRGELALDL